MKKVLLATTASVAALMLASAPATAQMKKAEKIKLSVGGYMEQWFGFKSEDEDAGEGGLASNNFDQFADSEISFKGKTTLPNGLEFGVKWELEGEADNHTTTSALDESTLYVEGSFGRINLGAEDNAAELMQYTAPDVGIGINKGDTTKWLKDPTGFNNTTQLDLGSGDNNKITYFTPRVSGVQLGVSYLPENDGKGDGHTAETAVAHHGIFVGVNFVQKVGQANVSVAAGWANMEDVESTGPARSNNQEGYSFGANVGFGNVTVGGSYLYEDTAGTGDQKSTWDFGVRFNSGANQFSVGYQGGKDDGTPALGGDNKATIVTAGYTRVLGPGVSFRSAVTYGDFEGEISGKSDDNSGFAVIGGIDLEF